MPSASRGGQPNPGVFSWADVHSQRHELVGLLRGGIPVARVRVQYLPASQEVALRLPKLGNVSGLIEVLIDDRDLACLRGGQPVHRRSGYNCGE